VSIPRLGGDRGNLALPRAKPYVFRGQMYCIEESTCDIVGTFRHPQLFGARCIVSRFPPLATPLDGSSVYRNTYGVVYLIYFDQYVYH